MRDPPFYGGCIWLSEGEANGRGCVVVKSVYPLAYVQVNQAQHVETNGYRIPCGESVNGVLRKTSLKSWSGGGIQDYDNDLGCSPDILVYASG